MKIFRPVKTNRIGQVFGENKACTLIQDGAPKIPFDTISMPASGKCPQGYESLYNALGVKGHTGIDFTTYYKEPIYFNVDAKDVNDKDIEWEIMKTYSPSGGYGVLVRSLSPIPQDESPIAEGASLNLIKRQYDTLAGAVHFMFYFGHLAEPSKLKDKSKIKFGSFLGYANSTGASTGNHVHFHMSVCGTNDDSPFFYLDGDSDYKGRLDPIQWFENEEALEVYRLQLKKQALTLKVLLLRLQLAIAERK